jgi:hypothetical protein
MEMRVPRGDACAPQKYDGHRPPLHFKSAARQPAPGPPILALRIMPRPSFPPTPLGTLLRRNLFFAALIFLVLELWRPLFFLTDDNLDGGYPFFMELGHHLLHGQSPFISDHLFGGHYDMLRDSTFFVWHPLYFLVSLLAGTPLHLGIIDVDAFVLFMIATAGFVCLADYLRREGLVEISNGWLAFFTLSFVYSMIAITTAASWLNFACNQSALPWLALGLLHRKARTSFLLIALFSAHEILGGHLAPTVSTTVFFSLFAVGLAIQRRSLQPALCWGAGTLVAILVALPLLVPAMIGFSESLRARGVPMDDMQAYNIPALSFPVSLFFGVAMWWTHPELPPAHETYFLALGSSAAIWCLVPALAGRGWRPIEWLVLFMILVAGFLVCRPTFVIQAMTHVPVLKSMRWPFRELLQFQFFVHLFLLLRRPGYTPLTRWRIALFSVFICVVPAFTYNLPPTFNSMSWDRRLILSGKYRDYWAQVHAYLKPGDRVAVLIPRPLFDSDRFDEPYSLLGTYNYACIDGIINTSGYSSTTPLQQLYTRVGYYPFGAYIPEQRADLLHDHPDVKFITLESLQPVKITLSSGTGPTIDLTPFIPHELDPKPHPVHRPGEDGEK